MTLTNKLKIFLASFFLFYYLSASSYAATYAYFFGGFEKVYKIDVAQNKIIPSEKFPYNLPVGPLHKTIFYDKRNNSLIVLQNKDDVKISVIDLKTFKKKNDLDLISRNRDGELPTIIVPPTGNDLFVKWFNSSTGKEVTTKYSNVDFKKIEDINDFPPFHEVLGYSADGTDFYSLRRKPIELKVYDSGTLSLKETRDLENIFLDKTKGWGDDYYIADTILFSENSTEIPSDPQNADIFYTYKIKEMSMTPRINSNTNGVNPKLSPDKKLLVLSEAKLHFMKPDFSEAIDSGTITVFNVETGAKIGSVTIPGVNKYSQIRGISPDSKKAYVVSETMIEDEYKLSIIDLTTLTIITEIPKIFYGHEMVFFEE